MTAVMPERWLQQIAVQPERRVRLVRAEGGHVWDDDGHKLLDLSGDDGNSLIGYRHPYVIKAVDEARRAMSGVYAPFDIDARDELLEMLGAVAPAPLSHVALAGSRTGAVEMALACVKAVTGRARIVTVGGASHGSTAGARAVSAPSVPSRSQRHEPGDVVVVPAGDVDALSAALDRSIAALILEPIQWDAAVRELSPEYLSAACAMCRRNGSLVISDEYRTALRTSTTLASAAAGVVPDVVCVGGGFASGLPFGAMVTTDPVAGRLQSGWYESPEAGGVVVCAAAVATLRMATDSSIAARARVVAGHLQERLRALRLPEIRGVQGRGHLAGIEVRSRAPRVVDGLFARGFLVAPARNSVIRLSPALTLELGHVDAFVEALAAAIVDLRRTRGAAGDDVDVNLRGVKRQRRGGAIVSIS